MQFVDVKSLLNFYNFVIKKKPRAKSFCFTDYNHKVVIKTLSVG